MFSPRPPNPILISNFISRTIRSMDRLLTLALVFASCFLVAAGAQAPPAHKSSARTTAPPPAEAALDGRIREAQAARATQDSEAIARANRGLAGLALREMAQLRLLEFAYPQAIELYRSSLEFEDLPDTRVDLAIAELDANQIDEAIAESNRALSVSPNDPRANTLLGRALMRKRQFPQAAAALRKAVEQKPDLETLYTLGICLLSSKDPADQQQAPVYFQKMTAMAGDRGSLHVLFGRAYRDADDLPTAAHEFQRALELDPSTPHAHYFLGLARLAINEWKPTPEADSEFLKESQLYPRDFLANYMLGLTASEERNYSVSDKYLVIAAEAQPRSPDPWLYLGLNAYAQENMKRAEEFLRKAVDLTGSDEARSNFQIRRAYVDLGRILSSSGRKDEAEKYLAKARELQNKVMAQTQQSVTQNAIASGQAASAAIVPLNPDAEREAAPLLPTNADPFAPLDASTLARAHLTATQRTAAAAQETRLRIVLGESLNDLATSEAVGGQYGIALTHFQQAEHWNPATPGLAKNLGLCAFKNNNYPEAIPALSQALRDAPHDAPVRAMLGLALFATDQFASAAKTFDSLGARGMQDPAIGIAWATSLARTGDLKKSSEVLSHFESPNLPTETLLLVGQLWTEIGDYPRAVATFQHLSQADPSLLNAHYNAGLAYLRWEHWPEAAAEFQAELALAPHNLDARYNLGFVALQQSKIEAAIDLFRQVIAAQPTYANAQYQLGKILLDRGQLDDAIAHLEIAAHLIPQVDYVHYQLQAAYRKGSRTAEADRELELYKQLKAKARAQTTVPQPNL